MTPACHFEKPIPYFVIARAFTLVIARPPQLRAEGAAVSDEANSRHSVTNGQIATAVETASPPKMSLREARRRRSKLKA
jgi:hypothetical protein